jgi:copper(I)-binding protein
MAKFLIASILFGALTLGATAQTPAAITVENAWARPTPPNAQAAAIYVTVTDHGVPDRLVGVSTPVAGNADLHETIHDGNVMKMRPVAGGLAISAAAPISLTPGGYHIMLTELKQPLAGGESFPLSLRFEKAGTVETTVTVRAAGTAAAMDMGGAHDMQHMNMPGMTKP